MKIFSWHWSPVRDLYLVKVRDALISTYNEVLYPPNYMKGCDEILDDGIVNENS